MPAQEAEPGGVADQRRERHQQAKARVPEGVEQVAGDGQADESSLPRSEQPEDDVDGRQEAVQERQAIEQHLAPVPPVALTGTTERGVRAGTGRSVARAWGSGVAAAPDRP